MTNINCSSSCIYEKNGKCTLNHVTSISMIIGHDADCAYFSPRYTNVETPPKQE
jgi:hypothetical protein